MKLIKTWAQLYERLDRQSLTNTKESCTLAKAKESRITLKNKDGSLSFLTLNKILAPKEAARPSARQLAYP